MISDFPISAFVSPAIKQQPAPIVARNLPSNEQIQKWGTEIGTVFKDGFQWRDVSEILIDASNYLSQYPDLTLPEKQEMIEGILKAMVANKAIPKVPNYFDPLFKTMVPSVASLILQIEGPPSIQVSGKPSAKAVETVVKQLLDRFKDGFDWPDLTQLVRCAIEFSFKYKDLTPTERAEMVKGIIDGVIDETEVPYLPDCFYHAVFKDTVNPIIDHLYLTNKH